MTNKEIITNDIKVPNKDMEVLKKYFSHCFDKNGDFQIEKFKQSISENEISFSKESYSMDWLGKSYARLLASDPARTLLKEDKEHNQKAKNKDAENLLLKGDNLEVLKHLTNAYYEKIKMIYIDPPYNTGGDDFVYQDDRKFTVDELQDLAGIDKERAQRILDFTQSKSNSHSAWLTFMYPRLYIAKQLLREDGFIFISIDDNELAQLRLLMDEIFGEENFIGEFIWIRKKKGAFLSKKMRKMTEYVLCYQKTDNDVVFVGEKAYSDKKQPVVKRTNSIKTLIFPKNIVQTTLPDGNYDKIINDRPTGVSFKNSFEVKNGKVITKLVTEARYVWTQQFLNSELALGSEVHLSSQYGFNVLRHDQKEKTKTPSTMLDNEVQVGTNEDASAEVAKLFKTDVGVMFDYTKPTSLIKYLIEIPDFNDGIILDFFAGSGTTGDAVMQLNGGDGGNRKYILVQLPESINPKKSKSAYDFVTKELRTDPTIFEITRERLIRAAKKINQELDEKNKKLETEIKILKAELPTDETKEKIDLLKEEIQVNKQVQSQNNFKVFETMPIWEDYHFEAKELDEQLKLFDETKLTTEDLEALLITWKTYDGIALTEALQEIDLAGYKAYYANDKLYLMDKDFTTENLKALLERIDSNKSFNPTSIIVFGYHFESKNLRGLAENLKSYSNKKNIDIDFITRY